MGLTRKRITVRSKRGKVYQRNAMVRQEPKPTRYGAKQFNKEFGVAVYGKTALAGLAAGAVTYGAAHAASKTRAGKVGGLVGAFAAHKATTHVADKVLVRHGWSNWADQAYLGMSYGDRAKVNHNRGYAWNAGRLVGAVGAHLIARKRGW